MAGFSVGNSAKHNVAEIPYNDTTFNGTNICATLWHIAQYVHIPKVHIILKIYMIFKPLQLMETRESI